MLRLEARKWCLRNCDNRNGIHHMYCLSQMWNEDGTLKPLDSGIDQVNIEF